MSSIVMACYASFWLGMAQFIKRSGSFVASVGKDLAFSLSQPAQKVMEYLAKQGMTLGSVGADTAQG